jgi:response regulator RpfG family c-di-GMP phosphodiesterase
MCALNQVITMDIPASPSNDNISLGRLLLVEDECFIGLMVSEQLADLGYTVIGPILTISDARDLAGIAEIDAALVDINLNNVPADGVADILSDRKIPFLFMTGYQHPPAGSHADIPVLMKPFQVDDLRRAVEGLMAKPKAAP